MCGVFSSMCRCAATTLSLPNVACSHWILSLHHSSSFLFLYVHHVLVRTRQNHPNDTDLVVRDFPSDVCRVQSVGNRFIPAVNASGYSTSTLFRCVLVGSAFLGIIFLSIWSDCVVSDVPFAFLMSNENIPYHYCFCGYRYVSSLCLWHRFTGFIMQMSPCCTRHNPNEFGFCPRLHRVSKGISLWLDRVFLALRSNA